MTPEQLRASILQKAMEGKLVSQDPNEESASELLKRIKKEKEKLIKEGKIKRDKNVTEIFKDDDNLYYEKFSDGSVMEAEVPYEIPETWHWVKLGSVCNLLSGRDLKRNEYIDGKEVGIPYLTGASNFFEGKLNSDRYTEKPAVISYLGDLLITVKGTIGEMAFNSYEEAHIARQIMAISSYFIDLKFVYLVIENFMGIIKSQAQSMIPGISREALLKLYMPIPPINEQKRILKKVNYLNNKIKRYEENYIELQKLNDDFPDKLRESILQYAMQGKLVKQDPNDETIEVLLEKIKKEKQKLYEEGKLKKKDLEKSVIYKGDDNSYYENIPESWKLSQLNKISLLYIGNSINRIQKEQKYTDVPGLDYIATKDVNLDRTVNYDNGINIPCKYIDDFKIATSGSILLCLEGGSAGKKIGKLTKDVCFGNKLCCIKQYTDSNDFLFYFLQSPQFLREFEKNKTGIIGGVSITKLGNIIFPLVPVNERVQIVEKVKKAFRYIDSIH